ncbi:MAG: hypothetical protein ACRC50_05310 [Gaiella sp.]
MTIADTDTNPTISTIPREYPQAPFSNRARLGKSEARLFSGPSTPIVTDEVSD